jgi:hypothetical protein
MMKYQNATNKMTVCYGKITNLTLRSKVTNNGTQHIIWRWSTYMPNMKSLSWTTKKLQPGRDLLRTHGPVCWGQSSRSKVTNNGTWHIVWKWSTYMPNMKSLSWTTKKLEPAHDLLRTQGPIWPCGQNSRSKVTNNGTRHIVGRWSTYMPNMKSLSWTTAKLQPGHDLLWTHGPVWPWGRSSRSKVTNNGTRHIIWKWSTYMPDMQSLSWTTNKLQPRHDLLRMHRWTDRLITIGRLPLMWRGPNKTLKWSGAPIKGGNNIC